MLLISARSSEVVLRGYKSFVVFLGFVASSCNGGSHDMRNGEDATEPDRKTYVAIAGGYHHTCALTDSGEAICWGNERFGASSPP